MDWKDPWLWIAVVLGVAGGVAMFIPFARVLKWRARMLDEIYGWFTEGFDTADLKDAKALLDELSA